MATNTKSLGNFEVFSTRLYEKMKFINPGIEDLELYEFQYALKNLSPASGWQTVNPDEMLEIEHQLQQKEFFLSIKDRPKIDNKIVLDEKVVSLTQKLFVGFVLDQYRHDWVSELFYFDIRGFFFIPRTRYFTKEVLAHFGDAPYKSFEKKQEKLKYNLEIGYKEYKIANADVDGMLFQIIRKLIDKKPLPILLTIAGPTAAGKTEIVSRLREDLSAEGYSVSSIEMDNFSKDKEYRDTQKNSFSTIHFDLFKKCMQEIMEGKSTLIPAYDFYNLVSSHDPDGNLRPGASSIKIDPADVIFLEGNFPFHLPEIAKFLGIKIVYMADDDVRLKRKWMRDIDLRKKYDPRYFQNRYFRTQFLRAQETYLPLMQVCEMVVDTSAASIWLTPELKNLIESTN